MRWSCETAALRDGPFGKAPCAVESRNVVRCDGAPPPTPASPAGAFALPLSVPTLKLEDVLSPPPHAASASAAIVSAATSQERVGDIQSPYEWIAFQAIGGDS